MSDTWVHIGLSVDHGSINTFIDGRPAATNQIGFSPASYETDWAQTAANLAYPDPTTLSGQLTGFALSGGSDGPILGAAKTSGWGMRPFTGSITFVTLWFQALTQDRVECLFQNQNQHIAVCPTRGPSGRVWGADLTDGRWVPREVQLKKNA